MSALPHEVLVTIVVVISVYEAIFYLASIIKAIRDRRRIKAVKRGDALCTQRASGPPWGQTAYVTTGGVEHKVILCRGESSKSKLNSGSRVIITRQNVLEYMNLHHLIEKDPGSPVDFASPERHGCSFNFSGPGGLFNIFRTKQ